ncbi:MAG: FAD-dependent oxidoreductase [bacterium]
MVDLTIDGQRLKVKEDITILQAAESLGIKIPTLCYHRALTPYGACRICLVEISINGSSQVQASCQYRVQPGMVVHTNSERVIRTRKVMLELLLARCPNSKRIRELADELGVKETRFPKRDEDCLLCGLCVRMCQERMGRSTIGFANRGIAREVVPPFEQRSQICLGCGSCEFVCPAEGVKAEEICKKEIRPITSEFDENLSQRSVIHIPFPQAIPNKAVIDKENCIHFLTEKCEVCKEFCEAEAIDFNQKEQVLDLDVGAVILAPGFEEFDARLKGEFGYGVYPNVVTSIEFERILSASGPYKGKVLRPSDQKHPRKIAFIQCVGSRDSSCNKGYCSSVCCMYATKEAIIAKEHEAEIEPTIFFMDMRAFGKDFDKYYERAQKVYGIRYIKSMVSSVKQMQRTQNLKIKYVKDGREIVEEEFDLVVLSVGLSPSEKIQQLGKRLGLELNKYGFCQTDLFSPVKTSRAGIYVCGAFQGPKDIPETVIQASGAASFAHGDLASARGSLVTKKEYPPEIDVRGQPPRIGAFICHCGINIGGVVDVPAVVKYAQTLPRVVYAMDNLYTCSQDTQEIIKEKIREHNLNRVIVASCSPRTHEPLFQETIREAGLNRYLFEMANIRDQCSWVHMQEPEAATEKAKDLIRMAVAKAAKLEPLQRLRLSVIPRGLVIGGGISGMTAALSLARQGFEVYLVEKEKELGGLMKNIHYTLEGEDTQKFLRNTTNEISNNQLIRVFTNTKPKEISGYIGNFKTILTSGEELEHGTIIVATGAQELKTDEYLYGKNKNVLTQMELEERLSRNSSEIGDFKCVVMIQCVGSREDDRPYCSRVCCSESIKNALKIKEINPETQVFVLYRDMRTYGFKEDYYRNAREKDVIFIRYNEHEKPEVVEDKGSLRVSVKDEILGEKIVLQPDLVVLGVATVPLPGNKALAQMLKVPLNDDGFFLEAHVKLRPVEFATEGIFVCGLAHNPKFLDESITQANAAASRASIILSQEEIEAEGTVAMVNTSRCSACGMCESLCAYKAIEVKTVDEKRGIRAAVVTEAMCKGCGACVANCRSSAIDLRGFTDDQIFSAITSF